MILAALSVAAAGVSLWWYSVSGEASLEILLVPAGVALFICRGFFGKVVGVALSCGAVLLSLQALTYMLFGPTSFEPESAFVLE